MLHTSACNRSLSRRVRFNNSRSLADSLSVVARRQSKSSANHQSQANVRLASSVCTAARRFGCDRGRVTEFSSCSCGACCTMTAPFLDRSGRAGQRGFRHVHHCNHRHLFHHRLPHHSACCVHRRPLLLQQTVRSHFVAQLSSTLTHLL